jgi:hypothetical protein
MAIVEIPAPLVWGAISSRESCHSALKLPFSSDATIATDDHTIAEAVGLVTKSRYLLTQRRDVEVAHST